MPQPFPFLLPETLLPSGWSIDPVTGNCIRISDGAQFGRATSEAIAWSTQDIESNHPDALGPAVDVARLRNAIGCALRDGPLFGKAKQVQATADAIHAIGNRLTSDGAGRWRWQPEGTIDGAFHRRLGCLLDAIGVDQARYPTAGGSGAEVSLLAGSIGELAVRSDVTAAEGVAATAVLTAEQCRDAGTALQRARGWAIEAARGCMATSPAAALALVHRIPFHADDVACQRLIRDLERALRDGSAS